MGFLKYCTKSHLSLLSHVTHGKQHIIASFSRGTRYRSLTLLKQMVKYYRDTGVYLVYTRSWSFIAIYIFYDAQHRDYGKETTEQIIDYFFWMQLQFLWMWSLVKTVFKEKCSLAYTTWKKYNWTFVADSVKKEWKKAQHSALFCPVKWLTPWRTLTDPIIVDGLRQARLVSVM